jgi:PIN domain nuclease of toxin-antitoxin system
LLDTHALLWWWLDDPRLPAKVHHAVSSGAEEVLVSAVSAMEITTKHRLGKLSLPVNLIDDLVGAVEAEGFSTLPITFRHARFAGNLTIQNRDPFDRFLVAQGLLEGLTLASNERSFDDAGVSRLW